MESQSFTRPKGNDDETQPGRSYGTLRPMSDERLREWHAEQEQERRNEARFRAEQAKPAEEEAWRVAQLAAVIYAGGFSMPIAEQPPTTDESVRLAQTILAEARKQTEGPHD